MPRTRPFAHAALLALLLLFVQGAGLLHPIGHLAEALAADDCVAVHGEEAAEPCLVCELLPGGLDGLSQAAADRETSLAVAAVVSPPPARRPAPPPASYQARAPPALPQ